MDRRTLPQWLAGRLCGRGRALLHCTISEAELADFTKTVVPVRITGALASPSVRPDIEAVFRQQVEGAIEEETEKLKNRLFDRLLGGGEEQSDEEQPGEQEPEEAESLEDQLKNKLLKNLIGR